MLPISRNDIAKVPRFGIHVSELYVSSNNMQTHLRHLSTDSPQPQNSSGRNCPPQSSRRPFFVKNVKLRVRFRLNCEIRKIAIFSTLDAQISITSSGFEKARANPRQVTSGLYSIQLSRNLSRLNYAHAYLNKRIKE
jgi:hypothetical protein